MKNTVTIVTGGAQGIGRCIAEFLASKGGDIAIFDIIDGSEVVQYIRERGQRAEFFHVDMQTTFLSGQCQSVLHQGSKGHLFHHRSPLLH